MAVSPVLVIKTVDDSSVSVRARLYDDFVEHEIVLNSVLAYWWANDLPAATKFLELFEFKELIRDVYFFSFSLKSIILMAVMAHSSPLLPYLPPLLSFACCKSSVVSSPYITGVSLFALRRAIP